MSTARCITVAAGLAFSGLAWAGGYVLTVDGKATELDLDQDTRIVVGGKPVSVRLERKAEQTFRGAGFRFDHPSAIQPTSRELSEQIHQIMLTSAEGNGLILQRYDGLDPTALVDLMVAEITDEEVAAGYRRKITAATRTLADGRELRGKLARTETDDRNIERLVVATRDAKGGYLLIAIRDDTIPPADVALLDRFWQTLRLD